MFVLTFIFGIITFSLFYLHWYQTRSRFAKLLNQFPTFPALPLVGHVLELSRNPEILFGQARKRLAQFSETFGGWSAYIGTLHIITADDAEVILSSMKYIEKGILYSFLVPWLGDGLLISSGQKWQHRRKILTPTFHFNILRRFVTVFGEHCDNLITKLKEQQQQNGVIDVIPHITNMTLGTICETAMGTKLSREDKTQNRYLEALHGMIPLIIKRAVTPLLYTKTIFNLSPLGWSFQNFINIVHKFTNNVISEREKNFENSDLNDLENYNEKNEDGTKKKRLAMLDLLISAKKNRNEIDNEGIREEVNTFMFEGFDTTAMGLCFALMTLAEHKDVQAKIIEEMNRIFGEDTRQANYEDLQEMNYLELCIKECLRLYPSVPLISRVLTDDVQLTHHVAPKGTVVFIHPYNVHRQEKYYPEPEKFNPNRFLPENMKGRHPYAYIPFSAGPRNCIGQKFAMLELKSVMSSIMRNFTLEPVTTRESIRCKLDVVLRSTGPIYVKFNARK